MYYVYMLRCQDNSIYTGITVDLNRRNEEHFEHGIKTAKYTFSHVPQKMEIAWITENKSLASKLEYHIKKGLTKSKKEKLIENPQMLNKFLGDKIDYDMYKLVKYIDILLK